MTSQIFRYSFTCHQLEKDMVQSWCEAHGKTWAFQLEVGELTGKPHFQGFIGLKKKLRKLELVKTLPGEINEMAFQPCGDEDATIRYVTKCNTRVDGPWTCDSLKDKVPKKRKWGDISQEKIDAKMKEFEDGVLKPWQASVWALMQQEDSRIVHWVYQAEGNAGKTWFAKWAWRKHGVVCITFGKAADLYYLVSKIRCNGYNFDLARNATVAMEEIYSAIETVKNGLFVSTKYETQLVDLVIEPSIVVFSNHKPDLTALSRDRWRLWTIVDDELMSLGTRV